MARELVVGLSSLLLGLLCVDRREEAVEMSFSCVGWTVLALSSIMVM